MEEEWKRLSEKEFQIMTYMWEENHPLTMNEIREKIGTLGKISNRGACPIRTRLGD